MDSSHGRCLRGRPCTSLGQGAGACVFCGWFCDACGKKPRSRLRFLGLQGLSNFFERTDSTVCLALRFWGCKMHVIPTVAARCMPRSAGLHEALASGIGDLARRMNSQAPGKCRPSLPSRFQQAEDLCGSVGYGWCCGRWYHAGLAADWVLAAPGGERQYSATS